MGKEKGRGVEYVTSPVIIEFVDHVFGHISLPISVNFRRTSPRDGAHELKNRKQPNSEGTISQHKKVEGK